jgi:putative hemolysin
MSVKDGHSDCILHLYSSCQGLHWTYIPAIFLATADPGTVAGGVGSENDRPLGAAKRERTAGRNGYRSGYSGRSLITRVGKLEVRVPQDRTGQFSTELLERYQRSERASMAALAEMYCKVQGGMEEMDVAALPGGFGQDFTNGRLKPPHDRRRPPHAVKPARPKSAQKFAPARAAFPIGEFDPEYLAATSPVDADGNRHGMADNHPGLAYALVAGI